MKKRLFLFIGIIIIALLLSLLWVERASTPAVTLDRSSIHFTGPSQQTADLSVEVADTETERETGLMFRDSLAPGTGMLFVFPLAAPLSFWMKNTEIPLDILFFDGEGAFISRATMTPCMADPCALYNSARPAEFAIEVNPGEPATNTIGADWSLDIAHLK